MTTHKSDPDYAALADQLGASTTAPTTVGRYLLHRQIARGGMATIHIARLLGDEGFSRIVAAKRLHPELAEDAEFVAMFLDEARIASKVHHRNVVPVLDVVTTPHEVLLVQELVHGAPLHWLLNRARETKDRIPVDIAVAIACQVLAGLHAAHELVDEFGVPLHVVHRDVSPQNVMVASDGTARLLDFGVAKASIAAHVTRAGTYKGKLAYSAPEQLRGSATRQSDVYSLAVVLWELIVGHRMHGAQTEAELVGMIMSGRLPSIRDTLEGEREWQTIGDDSWRMIEGVERVVEKGLAVDLADRWGSAAEMEVALTRAVPPATPSAVATWVKVLGRDYLDRHDRMLAAEEASWRRSGAQLGAHTTSRRATIAGESQVSGLPGALGSIRNATVLGLGSTPRAAEPAGSTPRRARLPGVLLGAAVASVVALVLLLRGGRQPSPAPPSTPLPTESPASPRALATPRERTVEPAVTTTPIAPAPPTTTITTTPSAIAAPSPGPARSVAPAHPGKGRRAAAPRAATGRTDAESKAVAPVPTAATESKPAAPAVDCTPPYYFEGDKKIFKPACL